MRKCCGFFFLKDSFFYHLVLILQGEVVFLPFCFHMNLYPKAIAICGITSGAGEDGGGCPFLGVSLLFLGGDAVPRSSSSLLSCDSATQSSASALIF